MRNVPGMGSEFAECFGKGLGQQELPFELKKMAVRLAKMSFSHLAVSVVCSVVISTSYVQRELEETPEACALECARLTCTCCGTQADVISFLLVLWKLYFFFILCI